jgi:Outer membrane lipoprotein carrier protein LolA-like
MRILIGTLCLGFSILGGLVCQPAAAAPDVAELSRQFAQRLEQRPVLRAEFVQQKQMAAFRKPLITRGRLVYIRNEGVIWKIESPLKLAYVLTDKRIVEIGEDGRATVRNAQEVAGLEQVGRVFRALLGAQPEAVSDLFTVSASGSMAAWQMNMIPKPGPLTQVMAKIQLSGGRNLDRLVIEETGGDSTVIAFRNTSEADAPSTEERTLLGVR